MHTVLQHFNAFPFVNHTGAGKVREFLGRIEKIVSAGHIRLIMACLNVHGIYLLIDLQRFSIKLSLELNWGDY